MSTKKEDTQNKKKNKNIKTKKIITKKQNKENLRNQIKKVNIKSKLNKKIIMYIIMLILDVSIIIYSARHNYANYITINKDHKMFVGDSKDLLFGKNYITLITTFFFFIYTLLANKILFHEKNTKKFIILLLLFLLILNIILFFIFTKRVY